MLSLERVRQLARDPSLSDQEAERLRDYYRELAEAIFSEWKRQQPKEQE